MRTASTTLAPPSSTPQAARCASRCCRSGGSRQPHHVPSSHSSASDWGGTAPIPLGPQGTVPPRPPPQHTGNVPRPSSQCSLCTARSCREQFRQAVTSEEPAGSCRAGAALDAAEPHTGRIGSHCPPSSDCWTEEPAQSPSFTGPGVPALAWQPPTSPCRTHRVIPSFMLATNPAMDLRPAVVSW